MSNELQQLFPVGKTIRICDENLTIKPFKFGELPRVFKAIEPITGSLGALLQTRNPDITLIANLIGEGGESIMDLMCIAAKVPRSKLDEMEMDEGVELLVSIFEVNADFFIQKVLPLVNAKMAKTAGPT